MSTSHDPAVATAPVPNVARRSVRLAWVSVAALPVSFFAALFVGDWLLAAQGYASGEPDSVPLVAAVLAGVPALLLLVSPSLPAIVLGLRARRLGLGDGLVPAVIGFFILAVSVVQAVVGLIISHWPA